jgi:cell division protein FtsQ
MTSAARIKRAGKRPAVKVRAPRAAPKTGPGLIARGIAMLPFDPRKVERAITTGLVVLVGVALFGIAVFAGVPQFLGTQIGQAIGRAGFEVKRVEVTGIDRMERLTVYAIALDQHSMAMPLVDLAKVREQLLGYGWIEEARVSRRWPDTLVVDIVERKPAALWQNDGKLSLIDAKGVVLEEVALDAMPDLPLLIGRDANRQAVALGTLMERAPALKPMLSAATWVGNRRWDLQFQSGETLALPEGEGAAAKALVQFARIDGVRRLLGRGFARFDMRDPTKFVARVRRDLPTIDKPEPASGEPATENQGGTANGTA